MGSVLAWLAHAMGLTSGTSGPYLFWSGFGTLLPNLAIVSGLVALYRKHVCGVQGCWRIGHKLVPGKDVTVCHKHFGAAKPTAHEVAEHLKQQASSIIVDE